MILGIIGPWQLMVLLLIPVLVIIGLIILFASRAKHKAKADTLDSVIKQKPSSNSNSLDQLERLNKLRESGALSDAEYEVEKKKILA